MSDPHTEGSNWYITEHCSVCSAPLACNGKVKWCTGDRTAHTEAEWKMRWCDGSETPASEQAQ